MPEGVALKHGRAVLTSFHLFPMDSRTGQTAYLKVALIVTNKTYFHAQRPSLPQRRLGLCCVCNVFFDCNNTNVVHKKWLHMPEMKIQKRGMLCEH